MPDTSDAWLTAMTFNTGSGPELSHDAPPDDGYDQDQAELTDAWYGNGLAWIRFIDEARAFIAATGPDLVAFQEIFHPGACADIPPEAHPGFVCEGWQPADPTVAQRVLGYGIDGSPDWQIACHPNRPDKCLAVRRGFGRIVGCDRALCLDGLEGMPVEGCGSGVRVARAVIALTAPPGGELVVVTVHGTSGFGAEDQACRVAQVEQIFAGERPLARASDPDSPILILGDFNTDPGRVARIDQSAARWLDFVGPEQRFHWISPIGPDAPGSYGGVFDIDHQVARGLGGTCRIAGLDGQPPVSAGRFFDHRPLTCALRRRPAD